MNKKIKPPSLSTSFSESGKSAKKRFENILNMKSRKTGTLISLLFIIATIICTMLVACDSKSIGIIGGTDGPTAIYTSDNIIKELYDSKIKYIGDNSGVSKILNLVFLDSEIKDFELKTANNEKKGVVINFKKEPESEILNDAHAGIMLALIENCDYVNFVYGQKIVNFSKEYLEGKYGIKFAELFNNYDKFADAYRSLYMLNSDLSIDYYVSNAILGQNKSGYMDGECAAEGHIILSTEGEVNSKTNNTEKYIAYVLATYGQYGFQNGNFTKVSGSGVTPVKITFDKDHNVLEYKEPIDGSEYEKSIREMYPKALWNRALSNNEDDYSSCQNQEHSYAKRYLDLIGRKAKIGEYKDFEHKLPDMNVDASNKLLDLFGEYPYWIGTLEKLENGNRVVYEKKWDNKTKIVTFIKYEYENKKVLNETVIDTTNGKLKYIKGNPPKEKN